MIIQHPLEEIPSTCWVLGCTVINSEQRNKLHTLEDLQKVCEQSGTKWNKVEQSGTKWNKVEQSGTKWNKVEQSGTKWKETGEKNSVPPRKRQTTGLQPSKKVPSPMPGKPSPPSWRSTWTLGCFSSMIPADFLLTMCSSRKTLCLWCDHSKSF